MWHVREDPSSALYESNQNSRCEWQESNLRTPTGIDLESITFGLSVTLALKEVYLRSNAKNIPRST